MKKGSKDYQKRYSELSCDRIARGRVEKKLLMEHTIVRGNTIVFHGDRRKGNDGIIPKQGGGNVEAKQVRLVTRIPQRVGDIPSWSVRRGRKKAAWCRPCRCQEVEDAKHLMTRCGWKSYRTTRRRWYEKFIKKTRSCLWSLKKALWLSLTTMGCCRKEKEKAC